MIGATRPEQGKKGEQISFACNRIYPRLVYCILEFGIISCAGASGTKLRIKTKRLQKKQSVLTRQMYLEVF